jgi:NAD(P) transhydrogenase subunit alpha
MRELSAMIVGAPCEVHASERRVALVPTVLPALKQVGLEVLVESSAGERAGFRDGEYEANGARLAPDRASLFAAADIVVAVHGPGGAGDADLKLFGPGQILVGLFDPLGKSAVVPAIAATGATAFSLELLPRVSRAQPMDALSSMATIAGYKAALMAAGTLHKLYPLMMTAAGTITPARVLIVGAGVAGLQAIATSRRLGAVVYAYDVRPAVKEQVESLGARFLEIDVGSADAEASGGYARAMGEEFYRKQRELMGGAVADSDVVITTAAVPGKKSPVLITEEMVKRMRPGSVIVDLAAEGGGNCELTRPGDTVEHHGVHVIGPVNLPSAIPYHASQMYARNITAFVRNLVKDGQVNLNLEDPIVRETLLTHAGEVQSAAVRESLGLPNPAAPAEERRQS